MDPSTAEWSIRLNLAKGLHALRPLWYFPLILWLVQAAVTLAWQISWNQTLAVSGPDFRAARMRILDGLLQLDPSLVGPGRALAEGMPQSLRETWLLLWSVGPPAAILALILAGLLGALLAANPTRLSFGGGSRLFFRMARLSACAAVCWAVLQLFFVFGFARFLENFAPTSGGRSVWSMIQTLALLTGLAGIKCVADLARIRIVREDRKSAFLAVTSSIGALLHDRGSYLPLFFVLLTLDAGCILLIHHAASAPWSPVFQELLWILRWSVFALHYLAIRELFQLLKAKRWTEELSHPSARLQSQKNW